MILPFAAAGHRRFSRQPSRVLNGRGDLSFIGSASGLPPHQCSCFGLSGVRAATFPASAQNPRHRRPFAAPSRPSAATRHRAFSVLAAAVLPGAVGHRSLSQNRLCCAPPHGGLVLQRIRPSPLPAVLVSPLSRRRMGGLLPASAKFRSLQSATPSVTRPPSPSHRQCILTFPSSGTRRGPTHHSSGPAREAAQSAQFKRLGFTFWSLP